MQQTLLVFIFTALMLITSNSQAQQLNHDQTKPVQTKLIRTDLTKKSTPLRIAVAANFTPVLKLLLKDFTKQTGIKSQIISGASGAMFLQIKHGAPFDIFLSADSRRPKALEQAGFALKDSRKTYAIGQLALYSSSLTANSNGLEQLNTPPQRFAIANPETAPYGKAAKQVLKHLGLWQQYEPRLIKGINIGQTFAQIRSKAVTLGIVANSQLVLNNLSGVIIPTSYHQPIAQQLVIMSNSKQQAAAETFSHFLLSNKSQNIIINYGYAPALQQDKLQHSVQQQAARQISPLTESPAK